MATVRSGTDTAALPAGFLEELGERVGSRSWSVDPDQLALHAAEQWGTWRGRAPLLLRPASAEEVATLLELCQAHLVPVVPQGGNTGLVGAGVPDGSGRIAVLSLRV
jgi:FAD/FMN-containing dehydrogenase